MKIALCTDAWDPQVNGVVTTLRQTAEELRHLGHAVQVLSPNDGFRTMALPGYPEIRVALFPHRKLSRQLDALAPDCLHIATEGPIGFAARRWARRRRMPFTTSYHTQFPEYVRARAPVPLRLSYAWLRRFHNAANRTLVATPKMLQTLQARGFRQLGLWTRGVDTELFHPCRRRDPGLPRPIWVYAGRLAVEKNLPAFLDLDLPGSKLVIGDGPDGARLRSRHPDVHFAGFRHGEELAADLASGDVFVFPSRTDTFGLVMLEAMASGLPVAAFPVTGPLDVVEQGVSGVLHQDLGIACDQALRLDRERVRAAACGADWRAAAEQFLNHLAPI